MIPCFFHASAGWHAAGPIAGDHMHIRGGTGGTGGGGDGGEAVQQS